MNERIRELAEQVIGPSRLHGGEFALMGNNQVEKFAELIVRECNQAVLSVSCYYQDYRAQIEEAVIHDCARAVLEHFNFESEEVTCPRCGLPDSGTSCGIPDCGLVTGSEE